MAKGIGSGLRRALVWTGGGFLALVLGLFVAWQAGALNGVALWAAGEATGYRIVCKKLEGGLLSRFTCSGLSIADAKGRFLEADRFSLDWDPWALIHNTVQIKRIGLINATLSRMPASQSASTSTGTGFLPGTKIAIAVLDARRITLATAQAPKVCVGLGGKAVIGPEGFDANLALDRCAPPDGHLALQGRYVKKSGALAVSVRGHDNGALVAALTGVKNAGASSVTFTGDGTLSAFNGRFALHAAHVASVDVAFAARDMTATSLNAQFDIVPALLPAWAPRGPGKLSADVTRGPDGAIAVSALTLDWAGLKGSGQVGLAANGALSGKLGLETGRAFVISGNSIGRLHAQIELAGSEKSPQLRGVAALSDIARGNTQIASLQTHFAATRASDGSLDASIVGDAHGAVLPAPAGGLLGTDFSFHATAAQSSAGALKLDARLNGAASTMIAKFDMGHARGSGHLVLTAPDLAKAHAGFAGSATATLNLPKLALNGTLAGTLTVEAQNIEAVGAGVALGPSPHLSVQLAAGNGSYAFSDIKVETAAVAATGSARLAKSGALTADLHTTRGELKPFSALMGRKLRGAFTVTAKAAGTMHAPVITVAADMPRARIDDNVIRKLSMAFHAHKEGQWSGDLTLGAKTPGGPVDLAAALATTANGWKAEVLRGKLGPATLSGQIAKQDTQYAGLLTLQGKLLEPVGFILGRLIAGSGTLRLRGSGKALRLVADVKNIHAAPLKDATLRADATLEGLSGPLSATLTVKDGTNHLAASADAMLKPLSATLTKFDGNWAGAPFALVAPTRFAMAQGQFTIDRTQLKISGGMLTFTAQGGGQALKTTAHLVDMPVGPLAIMADLGKAKGTVGLDLTADMTADHSAAQLDLRAKDVLFAGAGKTDKPANLSLKANWNGNLLAIDGRISGLDNKDATLTAQVPVVRAAGSHLPRLASSGPVSAQLRAQLQAGRVVALLPISEQTASGLLTASADVTGDIANPQFSGRVALADGSFTDYETGTKLEKLNASIDATGGSEAVLSLTATDGNSGTVKADGIFSMSALETGSVGKLAGHIDLALNDAEILREDLIHASASGKIAIDLPGDQPPKITGKLRTNTVRVDLGAAIPPSVPEIQVREINGGMPLAPKAPAKPSLFSRAGLDVAITMPNRVYVSGHGTDSEWSGNLKVAGTIGDPSVSGKLDLVRGQADLIGKAFTLQQGTVRIDSSIPGNASIHIVGQNESSDITATVTIDGPVTNPNIALSSSPALPQSEILSRLFFGTSTPHLSIAQAFQLAQLSGQLNQFGLGSGGSGGILGFARRLTGLDVLRVETPSNLTGAGASVTAGKYITDRVYVGVKQGTNVSAGSAQVQVKVTPHITLDAEAGANSQNSAGLSWKWDY